MAKLSVIRLTKAGELCELKKEDKSFYSIREVEKMALEAIFVMAANMQRDLRKVNVCYDLIEEVKAITDDMECFKINPTELKDFMIPAIEKYADNRPAGWYYARNMFKSIEKPEEIEVP